MFGASTVTLYLPDELRQQAKRGQHNFISKISNVIAASGLRIGYDGDDDDPPARAQRRAGFALFWQNGPVQERCLTISRTYIYPFWRIETQGNPVDFAVARRVFDSAAVDARKAANFLRLWQNRLHDMSAMDLRRDGFVFVPLDGDLDNRRPSAVMDQITVIETVLRYEKRRPVIVTLDSAASYHPDQQKRLTDLLDQHDRLYIRNGDSARYFKTCDYVVAASAATGFAALFFAKPVISLCKTDFHHITLTADGDDLAPVFAAAPDHAPDYAAYLYWFLQMNAINAGRPEAAQQVENALRGHGWPV